MSFEHLNLDERLLKAVEACGFQEPTPIQQQAIPVILDGEDLMGSAQTGNRSFCSAHPASIAAAQAHQEKHWASMSGSGTDTGTGSAGGKGRHGVQ